MIFFFFPEARSVLFLRSARLDFPCKDVVRLAWLVLPALRFCRKEPGVLAESVASGFKSILTLTRPGRVVEPCKGDMQ